MRQIAKWWLDVWFANVANATPLSPPSPGITDRGVRWVDESPSR
jgi:hypothetical protein